MIAPVAPIAPVAAPAVGAAAPALAPAPAAPVAPPPPPEPALVDRFSALMGQIGDGPAGRVHARGPSQLHRMIDEQDLAARATFEHIQTLSISDLGSGPEAAANIIQMQNEITMMSFKLNMVTAMAESSKSGIQTLMKNQ